MEGLAAVASASPARSLALSASAAELAWIAALCDAGDDAPRHLQQLQAVLQQAARSMKARSGTRSKWSSAAPASCSWAMSASS